MTFKELLEMRAEKDGEKPFVYFRDQIVDFATLDRKVNKAANLLQELGVKKGARVCLFLPNCPEFLYLWFGVAKLGEQSGSSHAVVRAFTSSLSLLIYQS